MRALAAAVLLATSQSQPTTAPIDYRGDAAALDRMVVETYAYLERWPGGALPDSPELARERAAVWDRGGLIRYAEHRLASLADHHAITGSSLLDSWALVPSYADLWLNERFRVEAVRDGSPAAAAGIAPGDRLTAVVGVPIAEAVARYWRGVGLQVTPERAAYAARVLAAGRRDRPRDLTVARGGTVRRVMLANLYGPRPDRPPVTVHGGVIRFNDSLGNDATIAAFDAAMARAPRDVVIDLTDTPGGGNTVVARAIMGWFVDRPTAYQIHRLPGEERRTGIARQWAEQVLPRPGKRHRGRVTVRVGRWTGSMGEGLAIGMDAIGARVAGDRMAGLLGAVYDLRLPASGLLVKLPAERLYHVRGTPRETFKPRPED